MKQRRAAAAVALNAFSVLSVLCGCAACGGGKHADSASAARNGVASAVSSTSSSALASATASGVDSVASTEAPAVAAHRPLLTLHLVPLGDVSDVTVAETSRALSEHAPVRVEIAPREVLPASALTSEKARYRADKLLVRLSALPFSTAKIAGGTSDSNAAAAHFVAVGAAQFKVMGVTDVDIVTEKNGVQNWGILGLGAIDGRSSVISTYRMKRVWENGGAPEALVRARLWKISLHELGHTLGLDHCPNKGCIMEDAHGTVKTVDSETELCATCAKKFADAVARLAQ